MPARILNGNEIRDQIKAEVAAELQQFQECGVRPGLAVILVGNNPASEIYTRNKVKSCESLGIHSERLILPETATTEELLSCVAELNGREEIDGILVQLPLPPQVDSKRVLLAVDPQKDVDGFHPVNLGNLVTQRPGLIPCTPAGILEILKRSGIPIEGQRAVVIGRSDIVGKPVALLLMHHNATVTVCHSRTRDLPRVCREADILVAALGKPGMVTGEFVKPGATVIDVGISPLTSRADVERFFPGDAKRMEEFERKGSTLLGDVDPSSVYPVAGAITPVPGGVGPLTIAMLMVNTVRAARLRRAQRPVAVAR
ncbi:MAG: bifunctional methylenetetrahydrofolate dehydrogenase/methenyltetrahydrofolate cyclohydrolase [Acidobacteria bacterium RIFCSPLOWO2_02_FULL_61_28]|nr:MAG: bifunctional methylenetetrahydrofolate dehydrogenase/methenyltetrahydrofolate cyclohydrolase [Acidobacteria bacterium RIFCSPLOWO2_02_FULL_61_28]